nr:hypothetical protein [Sedimentibacter sp.]
MIEKDKLGEEIRDILEEETFGMTLSQTSLDNILQNGKKPLIKKISDFLNKEIEIPIAPAIIGFAALFVIMVVPGDLFKSQQDRIIDIGGSRVIMRENYEVSKK